MTALLGENALVSGEFRTEDAPREAKNTRRYFVNEVDGSSKSTTRDYCASLSAADIALELFDDELLFSDDGFNEIADGNHTTYFACFDNRQMADPYLGH